MINLNKRRIDFGKGDVGIGVIGNTIVTPAIANLIVPPLPVKIFVNPFKFIILLILSNTNMN